MRLHIGTALIAAVLVTGTACSDSTGFDFQPVLVADTVDLEAPPRGSAGLPTALDVTSDGAGSIWGGRFPELSRDAEAWDFAVRIRDGELALVPGPAIGLSQSSAALTPALEGETFDSVREVPGQTLFVSDEPITMEQGRVYVARSRQVPFGFSQACVMYAKLRPLSVDVATGQLRVEVVTNQNCQDLRLVPSD